MKAHVTPSTFRSAKAVLRSYGYSFTRVGVKDDRSKIVVKKLSIDEPHTEYVPILEFIWHHWSSDRWLPDFNSGTVLAAYIKAMKLVAGMDGNDAITLLELQRV